MNQQNIPTAAIQFTEDQIEVIECGLQDFLAGLGKRDPVRLAEIASCGDWTRLAKAETERRFAELLTRLPLNEVKLPRFHGHFVDKTEGVRNAREEQAVPRAI